ncbi:MAG: alpha/beta hydrolase fold domain-containing protein [Phycisphaerales bacterium]|nr:alpha/beta hydrolase fold domain-containing protein [Phycisphaerales bacterium]
MARRTISLLMVLACVLASIVTTEHAVAQPTETRDVRSVLDAFGEAYAEQDWPHAIELGIEADSLRPNDATIQYNLACVYALNGGVDPATDWLRKAAASGFTHAALVEQDTDLDAIRDRLEYAEALAVIKKNRETDLAELEEKFTEHDLLVFLPEKYDPEKPAPLIIALHGYGGTAAGYPTYWREAAGEVGAILVAPQAVRRVAGAGYNWGRVEEANLFVRITLRRMSEDYSIDRDRVILTGFSQGGYIAYSLGVQHPEQFVGVVPMAGPYIRRLDKPKKVTDDDLPRFYFMVGARDALADQCRQTFRDFDEAGYDVKLRVYPGVGHTFPRQRTAELRRALKFVLPR